MKSEIFERFPDRETFDAYWKAHYVPVVYEDVKESFESFVILSEGHIFLPDYEENGCINRADFRENLSQEAQFMFQDALTEAFYDKNPELYEYAFAIFEESQMNGGTGMEVARVYGEVYRQLYEEFLEKLFDEKIVK